MLSQAKIDIIMLSDSKRPFLLVSDVRPSKIMSYLTQNQVVSDNLGKSATNNLKLLLTYLHEQMKTSDDDFTIFSMMDISNSIGLSASTLRRNFEKYTSFGLLKKHIVKQQSIFFIAWEVSLPDILQEVKIKTTPSKKSHSVQISSDKTDKLLLNWAENLNQPETNMVILYGRNIFKILKELFLKKHEKKIEKHSISKELMIYNTRIPAVISCNVNSELPYTDDLIRYFALLECVEQSMRENHSRNPGSVLKKITYEVPINKIFEQLGMVASGINRKNMVLSLKRLEAKIELTELPESEYLMGKESFISFQPISNLSVLKVKKLDKVKVTGDGVLIATFTLPDFIVNSLIQRVGSFTHDSLTSINQAGLIEELLELPSIWLKGKYDLLAEILLTLKAAENTNKNGKIFMTWVDLHHVIESSKGPGALKLAVWALALKKGGFDMGGKTPKLIMRYKDVEVILNDDGVTLIIDILPPLKEVDSYC